MFNPEALGKPEVKIEGFRLWVHSREHQTHPQAWSASNWLDVTACCEAEGALVHVSGSILVLADLLRWRKDCEGLQQGKLGEAVLKTRCLHTSSDSPDLIDHHPYPCPKRPLRHDPDSVLTRLPRLARPCIGIRYDQNIESTRDVLLY